MHKSDVNAVLDKFLQSAAVCTAILAAGAPVLAAQVQLDGQLPMYPHGKLDAKEASVTPAAIAQGVPLVLLTSDSLDTVDRWYALHVPQSCGRQTAGGGIKFACSAGSIMVYEHNGQTQIALIPPMPGLSGLQSR